MLRIDLIWESDLKRLVMNHHRSDASMIEEIMISKVFYSKKRDRAGDFKRCEPVISIIEVLQ